MANWMIRLGEEYLAVLYDYLPQKLYDYHVVQADETPVLVNRDGRPAETKSYMWVYRSGHLYEDKQIVLYDYQKTRNASHPREFLRNHSGICVTDGYQVYHTVEKELEDLTIAGCWVHARRRFEEALTVIPKEARKESVAYLVMKQIQAICREEGKLTDLSSEEQLRQRQLIIKPLVDALFVYFKQHHGEIATKGFCIGKKNREVIDTINGVKTSAVIYSIAETAKANKLKLYEYFEYLLTEIPKHMAETNRSFLDDLLPWSPNLPENIRK